jgi:tetratricopeptide (TPR) repeat protein
LENFDTGQRRHRRRRSRYTLRNATTNPVRYRVLFDRTERLFSKGQRALAARDFEAAVHNFETAIATDEDYPHLYMYLGIAKAELGQLNEASLAINKAMQLDPRNFVFPMELGVRYLDAGEPKVARDYFIKAEQLAPGNALATNYIRLVSWEAGEGDIEAIMEKLADIPLSFRARLLLSVWERLIRQGQLTLAMDDPLTRNGASTSPEQLSRLGAWWRRRTLRQARRRIDGGDIEGALGHLLSLESSQSDSEMAQLLTEAREKALELTRRQLDDPDQRTSWLQVLWWRMAGKGPDAAREFAERTQRALQFDLAQLQLDLGRSADAYEALVKWRESFMAGGQPRNECRTAAAVSLAMAKIDIVRGEDARGVRLCIEAREHAHVPGVDWVEGIGRLVGRDRRRARYLFEDHLHNALQSVEPGIRRVIRLIAVMGAGLSLLAGW